MRLRSDFVVMALVRAAEGAGAFAHVARKGDGSAGAIFVVADRLDGTLDLYAPAPQALLDEGAADRLFTCAAERIDRAALEKRLASEARFDPDFWVVEIEDREGRPFVPLV